MRRGPNCWPCWRSSVKRMSRWAWMAEETISASYEERHGLGEWLAAAGGMSRASLRSLMRDELFREQACFNIGLRFTAALRGARVILGRLTQGCTLRYDSGLPWANFLPSLWDGFCGFLAGLWVVYSWCGYQKKGPRSCGGHVALVLSWRESFVGGQRRGGPSARKNSLGGGLLPYGRSAPVEEATPWGGATSWAAKLFSINRTCTLLVLIRAGLESSSPTVVTGTLPRATACKR